ncbi:MAG TPA: HNH endonuclease signature motif containing protein [Kofleriaceae bacterium]|nr:HNH endonuclease signature motif containing protein [Kofleriaceae bacterium]
MAGTKYTAALLGPIVASSFSFSDVVRKLGLTPNGGNHRLITARIRQAGLDTSHFKNGRLQAAIQSVSVDRLEQLVRESTSVRQVLEKLQLPTLGRAHHDMGARIRKLGFLTSHFTGRGWARGHTQATHPSVAKVTAAIRFSDDIVFVENGPTVSGPSLAKRLVAMGWPYRCALCGISEWCGKSLVLHVDHINGVHNDQRLENLRLLCPNCHSQTDTYCNRRRPLSSRASEPYARYVCYTSAATRACRNR